MGIVLLKVGGENASTTTAKEEEERCDVDDSHDTHAVNVITNVNAGVRELFEIVMVTVRYLSLSNAVDRLLMLLLLILVV